MEKFLEQIDGGDNTQSQVKQNTSEVKGDTSEILDNKEFIGRLNEAKKRRVLEEKIAKLPLEILKEITELSTEDLKRALEKFNLEALEKIIDSSINF